MSAIGANDPKPTLTVWREVKWLVYPLTDRLQSISCNLVLATGDPNANRPTETA
jgi:hypothetical protein